MNSFITFSDNNNFINKNESNLLNNQKYSQYINLSNDDIIKETELKKNKIMEYNNTNTVLKNELTNILEKINLFSLKNKDYLNKKNLTDNNLEILLNTKKNDYLESKKFNTYIKSQYKILLKKVRNISEKKNC